MSFNPVRAASFSRNRGRGVRHAPTLNDGIKHSDIMKRQGLGITVPMSDRKSTGYGFAATLMENDKFVVRSEVIAQGNNLGLGFSPTKDRLLLVRSGSLFVQINDEVTKQASLHRLQLGAHLRIPAGMVHRIAASGTEDSEILLIEEPGYAQSIEYIEAPQLQGMAPGVTIAGATPETEVTHRRTDQSVAKAQAVDAARKTNRRRPARIASNPTPAATAGAGGRAPTAPVGATQVIGVNPRPMGAGAFSED